MKPIYKITEIVFSCGRAKILSRIRNNNRNNLEDALHEAILEIATSYGDKVFGMSDSRIISIVTRRTACWADKFNRADYMSGVVAGKGRTVKFRGVVVIDEILAETLSDSSERAVENELVEHELEIEKRKKKQESIPVLITKLEEVVPKKYVDAAMIVATDADDGLINMGIASETARRINTHPRTVQRRMSDFRHAVESDDRLSAALEKLFQD